GGQKLGFSNYARNLRNGEIAAPVRIVVKPSREIAVQVADANKAPVAGAVVEAVGSYGLMAHGTTEADGTARLPGPVDSAISWVVAEKKGIGLDYAEFVKFDSGGSEREGTAVGDLPESVALTLEAPRVARIKAIDQNGKPMVGAGFYIWLIKKEGRRTTLN